MRKLIICGKLFDGIRDEFREKMEILIEDGKILAVGRSLIRDQYTEIIDLSELTVTPGLIDAHVHGNILKWQEWDHNLLQSEGYNTLAFLHTAQRCLERGFTTVRMMGIGSKGFGIVDCKKLINRGFFPGSRLIVSGHMLGGPGMPGDMSIYASANPEISDILQHPYIGNGKDFFRNQVRRETKYGSDFIKVFISGSFLSPDAGPDVCYLADDEIKTIINTSHELGKPVTAHVYPCHMMRKLLKMGIDGMEHGSLMDEKTAELFEKSNTYLVPTFSAYQDIIDGNENLLNRNTEDAKIKLCKYASRLKKSRQIIINSKIRLGFGSDLCSIHQPYESCYEYKSWIRNGMGAIRTLKAATAVNAAILGLEDKIGTLEAGKQADIAGWHRNLDDEDALFDCSFVMKDGIEYQVGNELKKGI